MKSRRNFIKLSALGAGALVVNSCAAEEDQASTPGNEPDGNDTEKAPVAASTGTRPLIISTWNHGLNANKAAWEKLHAGGSVLDAVEMGVMDSESDPNCTSVGYGGWPDREGKMTLDACIMDDRYNCGSVAFLQDIMNPIAVARKVMEETPHVMLAGEGARQFALEQGFEPEDLLHPEAEKAWKKWLEESKYETKINFENNHDTIGMLALDNQGRMAGACTTSGLAFKMHGRVGDSPIIGAALYVDGEVGGACATGVGEAVIKTCGSHAIVEMMRHGATPDEACKEAVERIYRAYDDHEGLQVGYLAMTKDGEVGSYSMYNGFNYARHDTKENLMVDAESKLTWE